MAGGISLLRGSQVLKSKTEFGLARFVEFRGRLTVWLALLGS